VPSVRKRNEKISCRSLLAEQLSARSRGSVRQPASTTFGRLNLTKDGNAAAEADDLPRYHSPLGARIWVRANSFEPAWCVTSADRTVESLLNIYAALCSTASGRRMK